MNKILCLGSLVCILNIVGSRTASAALIVSSESHAVSAGTTVIENITVTNSTAASTSDIEGMAFTFQIGNGTGSSPKITSIDLLTGTIWAGHVSAADITTPIGGNQLEYQSRDVLTDLPGDFVNANGLVAKITIDTTGASPGDYSLKLIGTKVAGRDSAFLDGLGNTVQGSFSQGTLSVWTPEPSSLLLLGLGITANILPSRKNKKMDPLVDPRN